MTGSSTTGTRSARSPSRRRRDAERRDAARRPAVTVGPRAVHRAEDPHPPPPRSHRHRHRRHRAARRRGRTSCTTSERLAREIVDGEAARSRPIARRARSSPTSSRSRTSQQRTGLPIECCCFIGSSPIRRYAEDWTVDYLQRCTEEAIGFAVRHGLKVMYVTEDTTRSDPDTLRRLFTDGDTRRRLAHLHCRHRGPLPRPPGRAPSSASRSRDHRRRGGRRHRHRLARAPRSRPGHDQQPGGARSGRLARARHHHGTGRARRQHAARPAARQSRADGVDRARSHAPERSGPVSCRVATGEPIPDNYPVFGRDAFRTATGVHAAAVIKAFRKHDPT